MTTSIGIGLAVLVATLIVTAVLLANEDKLCRHRTIYYTLNALCCAGVTAANLLLGCGVMGVLR